MTCYLGFLTIMTTCSATLVLNSCNRNRSAFKEYWGWAWAADYVVTIARLHSFFMIQASSANNVSECSTSNNWHTGIVVSSVSCLCWYEHHKTAVQSAYWSFPQRWWQVVRPLQLHCLVGSILLYHVSAHLPIPVFVNNLHSRQQVHVVSVFAVDNLVCESHQYTRIHKAFEGVRGSQEQACDKCQPIIHTYI